MTAVGAASYQANLAVQGDEALTDLAVFGVPQKTSARASRLLLHGDGRLMEKPVGALNTPRDCGISVVAGDFDNDMDVDLYQVCARKVVNLPNVLFENTGDGNFIEVPDAGGATGSLQGVGGAVTTATKPRNHVVPISATTSPSSPT